MINSGNRRKRLFIVIVLAISGAVALIQFQKNSATAQGRDGWRTASREPVGLAPDPALNQEAIVQVYAARAYGWRGYFGVHSWIAVKKQDAPAYTVYEVIGWRLRWGDTAVTIREREADARWFGNAPELLSENRGNDAAQMIDKIDQAAKDYPFADQYSVWPGPNSNTFIAHILRRVPELKTDLPPTAIGKDYLTNGVVDSTPAGGFQFSLSGLFGIMASLEEGLEINLLGLTFGIDPLDPALKLPLIGRIGPTRVRNP